MSAMKSVALKSISSRQAELPAPPTMASGGQAVVSSPCAGCKFLRRKCHAKQCIFAPYFPPDQPKKFVNVHRVFGASNVSKILNEIKPFQREDAVNSLAYEAEMRLRDPVHGCVGIVMLLQRRLYKLKLDLFSAQSELENYQSVAEGIKMKQLQQHQLQQQQQKMMMMMRGYAATAAAEMAGSFARPSLAGGDDHQQNTLGPIS